MYLVSKEDLSAASTKLKVRLAATFQGLPRLGLPEERARSCQVTTCLIPGFRGSPKASSSPGPAEAAWCLLCARHLQPPLPPPPPPHRAAARTGRIRLRRGSEELRDGAKKNEEEIRGSAPHGSDTWRCPICFSQAPARRIWGEHGRHSGVQNGAPPLRAGARGRR